jgi:hypothetical protein
MIVLILAQAVAAQAAQANGALELCRPVLARKAGGEIATIEVESVRAASRGRTIEGRLSAFLGMGPPPPGSASTHHLIRAEFTYRCRVRGGRVREARLNPLGG